jgi:hypothetical protein
MPAKSKAQQKTAGAALSVKRGEQKVSELKGPAKSMYKSMSEGELDKMLRRSARTSFSTPQEELALCS